jgi:hypothetical protein
VGDPSLYHLRDTAGSLEEGSDEELVGDIFDLSKTERLTEQLAITIASVFDAPDAAKLIGIIRDWVRHTDEDQVCAGSLENKGEFHTCGTDTRLMRSDAVSPWSVMALRARHSWQSERLSCSRPMPVEKWKTS